MVVIGVVVGSNSVWSGVINSNKSSKSSRGSGMVVVVLFKSIRKPFPPPFTDAYDVLLLPPATTIVHQFLHLFPTTPVLISGEVSSSPDESLKVIYHDYQQGGANIPPGTIIMPYINSGE